MVIKTAKLESILGKEEITMSDELFKHILDKYFAKEKILLPKKIAYPFGTNEWVDSTFNTYQACSNACINCYGWNLAHKKKLPYRNLYGVKMTKRENWNKRWRRKPNGYWIMHPSMHDIFEDTVKDTIVAVKHMLEANINVLIVTKPRIKVIKSLIKAFPNNKSGQPRIKFRFSISTNDDDQIAFWEENAPRYNERDQSLKIAYKLGYGVGVSCEPFLLPELINDDSEVDKDILARIKKFENNHNLPVSIEVKSFLNLVAHLLKYVNDELWIGMMNYLPKNINGEYKIREILLKDQQVERVFLLRNFYKFKNIFSLISILYDIPNIMWKESIKKEFIKHEVRKIRD